MKYFTFLSMLFLIHIKIFAIDYKTEMLEFEDIEDLSMLDEFKVEDDDTNGINSSSENSSQDSHSTFKDMNLENPELENINPFEEIELDDKTLNANRDQTEKIDFKLIKEFEQYKKNNVAEILNEIKMQKDHKYNNFELEALKVQLEDISKSDIQLTHIPKGSKLTRLKDGRFVYPSKSMTVRSYTLLDFNKDKYIVDKNGKMTHKIPYQETTDIKDVSNLYRRPHKFIRYKKKSVVSNLNDNFFPLSLHFNLHSGLNIPTYTNDLVGSKTSITALFRSEITLLSESKLFFNSGPTLMYEAFAGNLENGGTYSINSLSAGPTFKIQNFINELSFLFQPRLSLFSEAKVPRTTTSTDILKLSETSLLLALETRQNLGPFGIFNIGFNIQKKWINTNTQKANYTISDNTKTDDAIGVYIGHRSDWIW